MPDQYNFFFNILESNSEGYTPSQKKDFKLGCKTNFHRVLEMEVSGQLIRCLAEMSCQARFMENMCPQTADNENNLTPASDHCVACPRFAALGGGMICFHAQCGGRGGCMHMCASMSQCVDVSCSG